MSHPDDFASLRPCVFLHVAVAAEGLPPSAVLGVLRPPRALRHPGEPPAPELLDEPGRPPRPRTAPPSSASCARPARSATRANCPLLSSSTISAGVRASDLTGRVHGAQPRER